MKRLFALIALGLPPATVFAQAPTSLIPESGELGSGCSFVTGEFGFECFPLYIAYLIQVVFGFCAGFALVGIIFAGYKIAIGGYTGDKDKGKEHLKWSLIGLAICVLAFLIVDFLVSGLLLPP